MIRLVVLVLLAVALIACDRAQAVKSITLPVEPGVVAATGYGPLRAGMTGAEASAATEGSLTIPVVASAQQCDYATWPVAPRGMSVMFEGGVLVRVDVVEAGIRTPEGLEVGATAARADSLYAASALRRPHKYSAGEYLILRPLAPADTLHRLVIEIVEGRVTAIRVGQFPAVEYVEGCS